jgi:hypothetical protein
VAVSVTGLPSIEVAIKQDGLSRCGNVMQQIQNKMGQKSREKFTAEQ